MSPPIGWLGWFDNNWRSKPPKRRSSVEPLEYLRSVIYELGEKPLNDEAEKRPETPAHDSPETGPTEESEGHEARDDFY